MSLNIYIWKTGEVVIAESRIEAQLLLGRPRSDAECDLPDRTYALCEGHGRPEVLLP